MGKADEKTAEFLSNDKIFADVFNHGMFQGNNVIQPGKLIDLDTASRHQGLMSKVRDVVKKYDDQMVCKILGAENQQNIHFAMPLRIMDYDLRSYEKQRQEIQAEHKKEKDLKGSEYLSGFSKTDRLMPVCTLVIYWGKEAWTGPKDLHDMLQLPEQFKAYPDLISNYRMHLLEIRNIENLETYTDELRRVLGFVKYQGDRDALLEYVQSNEALFREVSAEEYDLIREVTHSMELESYSQHGSEGGKIDMCEALKQLKEDGGQEGLRKGVQEGLQRGVQEGLQKGIQKGSRETKAEMLKSTIKMLQNMNVSKDEIIIKLVETFGLSTETASKYADEYCK